jgi:hypothetical protein
MMSLRKLTVAALVLGIAGTLTNVALAQAAPNRAPHN